MELCPCGRRARYMDHAPHANGGHRAHCEACVAKPPDGWTREELSREPYRTNDRPPVRANRLLR